MREPKNIEEKLVYDSVNFLGEFILAWSIVMILLIPFMLL